MSVVVRKSSLVVVRPSEPVVTTGKIELSPYDKFFAAMPTTALLVFERPIHEPAETIKRGLSQALVHYHPISGRLAAGDTASEVHIKCTGEGASFVSATADCSMEDVKFFDQPFVRTTLLDELAIYYPAEGCGSTDPLLMMQVTEFSCGGFVVGVTWNHAIADGAGMGQFLRAVGELARGLPSPSVVPVRWDDSVMVIPPYIDALIHAWSSFQPIDMALLDITIPSSLINRIKDEFRGVDPNGQPCTVFEAATAVLWQCRTRAIISDPEAPTVLSFAVNARRYAVAKDGYYGNCLTSQLVMGSCRRVANGNVMDIVKMIQHGKRQIPDQFKKDGGDCILQQLAGTLPAYNLFGVTCWRKLGLDEADFGGGKPAMVMTHTQLRMDLPGCVLCLPCKRKDGSNVASLCVKEEHAEAFLGELARFT